MRLRPVPARLQRPAVDDIADEVDRVGVVDAQEIEQLVGLRAARAEVHVGNKQGAKTPLRLVFTHQVTSHARA